MLRTTSKQVEKMLIDYPIVVRCHRAFLVNLWQVEKVISKAGSMQLLIKHSNDSIPVSRSNMASVKQALAQNKDNR
ncbi:MAG: LytTR family transcriptional regulator, partial [Muribaculaceae bacterium]|nr:LytTR family transcriptional regulator [Muribaculaceae bacterium]